MSGGTPTQNAVLFTLILAVVGAGVAWVVIARMRRARATGAADAEAVQSQRQAKEIADRLVSFGAPPEPVRVRGAARLFQVLKGDDRFVVTPRDDGDEYWSFTVQAADRTASGDDVVRVLARNGVTAAVGGSG